MRIDARAFGLAAGVMSAGLFVLCAAAVALAPEWTTRVASTLVHVDLSGLARTLTWSSFLAGLVCWTLGTALVFAAVGALYNRFRERQVAVAASARHAA